jgi:hypothetical protein
MGRSTRVRAIGLVGAVLYGGCATSDEGESTGNMPFTTQPGGDSADDDDGGETGSDDDGGSSATAPAEDGGSNPTIAESGDEPTGDEAADEAASIDEGEGPFEESGGFDEGGFETGVGGGECCEPSPMPGCVDDMVAQCVCAEDPYCCEMEWNEECIFLVDALGCGFCFGGESGGFETGGFETGGGGGDCCTPGPAPGCGDPMIEQCVCGENMDVFCCEEQWDEQCVDEAAELCGAC